MLQSLSNPDFIKNPSSSVEQPQTEALEEIPVLQLQLYTNPDDTKDIKEESHNSKEKSP